jgi:hypothetical protein
VDGGITVVAVTVGVVAVAVLVDDRRSRVFGKLGVLVAAGGGEEQDESSWLQGMARNGTCPRALWSG